MGKYLSNQRKAAQAALLAALVWAQASPLTAYGHAGHVHNTPDYSGHWSEPLIQAGIDVGILEGYEDGSFRPEQGITRAELAVLLNRAFPPAKEEVTASLADVPSGAWYEKAAVHAAAAGYLAADHEGRFYPGSLVTRAEAAELLARLLSWEAEVPPDGQGKVYQDLAFLPEDGRGGKLTQAVSADFLQASADGFLLSFRPLTRSEALLAVAKAKGTAPLNLQAKAFTAVQEWEGTLKDEGLGFKLRVNSPDGGYKEYSLSPERSLSGTPAVQGIDGIRLKLTAVAGLLPDQLLVLGIGSESSESSESGEAEEWEGILLEGHHNRTAVPGKHKKLCLLMPDCAASGFGISVPQADGTYKYYKFDNKGHHLAAVLIDSITKESHIAIHVEGSLNGDILEVSRIYQSLEGVSSASVTTDSEGPEAHSSEDSSSQGAHDEGMHHHGS
jgi:hypothetical protein